MDKKHRLESPNNESLRTIEQVSDRSELSVLYRKARSEWEGKNLITEEERQSKQFKEHLHALLGIRRRLLEIALLPLVPFVLFALLSVAITTNIAPDNYRFLLIGVIFAIGVWGVFSFLAVQRVYAIFYKHGVRATPFLVVLLSLVGLATQASFLLTNGLVLEPAVMRAAIVSGLGCLASIPITAALLYLWTSPRIPAKLKIAGAGLLAIALMTLVYMASFL